MPITKIVQSSRLNGGSPKGRQSSRISLCLCASVVILTFSFELSALSCFAGTAGTTGAQFLKLGVGSRPAAMGEACVAATDDVNSIYWNPAGLSLVKGRQVSFVHTEWLQSIRYEYLAYCQPALGGTIGAGITYLYIDGIERRGYADPTGATNEGPVPANDLSAAVSYARPVSEKLDLGLSVKFIRQQLDDRSAMGAAIDAGMLFRPGKEGVTAGVALQNIGYEAPFITRSNPLPANLKAGIASRQMEGRLTLSADLNYGIMDSVWAAGAGIEYWLVPVFSVRAGYKYNSAVNNSLGVLSGLTCGAGFKIGILNIDYAFIPYGDLGSTHRISILAKF